MAGIAMRTHVLMILALIVGCSLLVAGCTSTPTVPTPKVSVLQKAHAEAELEITTILADTIEATDAAAGTKNFTSGKGGTIVVDGHGTTTVEYKWTGSANTGSGTINVKDGGTTVTTYTADYLAAGGTTTFLIKGNTSTGVALDLKVAMSKSGTETSLGASGKATKTQSEFSVSGGSKTDTATTTASWGYTIKNEDTDVRLVVAVQFKAGTYTGAMTITKGAKPIAASVIGSDGSVTVTYIDSSKKTIPVFPDPTRIISGGDPFVPTVTAEQKQAVAGEFEVTSVLADVVEAMDAAFGSANFTSGNGSTVTVDGHGPSANASYTWAGNGTGGRGNVTVKSGTTTVATYSANYAGTTGVYAVKVGGHTPSGLILTINLTYTKAGSAASIAAEGRVEGGGHTYSVSGASTTDSAGGSATWAYVIADSSSGVKVTVVSTFAAGVFTGTMVLEKANGDDVATATTGANGVISIVYADSTTATVEVFPDPSK